MCWKFEQNVLKVSNIIGKFDLNSTCRKVLIWLKFELCALYGLYNQLIGWLFASYSKTFSFFGEIERNYWLRTQNKFHANSRRRLEVSKGKTVVWNFWFQLTSNALIVSFSCVMRPHRSHHKEYVDHTCLLFTARVFFRRTLQLLNIIFFTIHNY